MYGRRGRQLAADRSTLIDQLIPCCTQHGGDYLPLLQNAAQRCIGEQHCVRKKSHLVLSPHTFPKGAPCMPVLIMYCKFLRARVRQKALF